MNLLKKNKLVIIILLVIAVSVGAIYAYAMQAPAKIESKKVDFIGTSDQLFLKILEDPAVWQDKIVVISGKVTSIDDNGILLSASIYCQLKDTTVLKKINPTNDISLKGRIIGYDDLLEELKLDQCIIQ